MIRSDIGDSRNGDGGVLVGLLLVVVVATIVGDNGLGSITSSMVDCRIEQYPVERQQLIPCYVIFVTTTTTTIFLFGLIYLFVVFLLLLMSSCC